MRHVTRWVPMILASISLSLHAQNVLQHGNWQATLGPHGPDALIYDGRTVVSTVRLLGFKLNWTGHRFAMDGATVTTEGAIATWHKATLGDQKATLRLELSDTGALISLETELIAAGPSEFSINVICDAVATTPNHAFIRLDGDIESLDLTTTFPHQTVTEGITFERPERSVAIRCSHMQLQDRRQRGGNLFFVSVIGHAGMEPRTVTRSFQLSVQDIPKEQHAARSRIFAQIPVERRPMVVPNGDFEDEAPLSRWRTGPCATADTAIKREGRAAARLMLNKETANRNTMYLTQNVPVIPGRSYQAAGWVRADMVTRVEVGGMASVGATIIIEYAGKDGKWLAPGSYAKGLFGTENWKRLETEAVLAPPGAGAATIFLALRGHGTTWFDNITLQEVRHNTVRLEPCPEAAVHDNTPTFKWFQSACHKAHVELSQKSGFPADAIISVPAKADSATVKAPLSQGTWYWRVLLDDSEVATDAWRFSQTAPQDLDCTPPTIGTAHQHVSQSRARISLEITDNRGPVDATVRIKGCDDQVHRVRDGKLTFRPPGGWAKGLTAATIAARDAAGNETSSVVYITQGPPPAKTRWLQRFGVETDGKRRFVLGMYGVRTEDMQEIAEAGFDVVHNYAWDGTGSNESALAYLDQAQLYGMQAFIGLCRARQLEEDDAFIAQRIAELMQHPGLFAWYLFDEPDLSHQYVPPEVLRRSYQQIKGLDPCHPVILTCAGDGAVPRYRGCSDVYWTQVYGDTAFVARRIPRNRADIAPETAHAAILHCYDRNQSKTIPEGAIPDPAAFQPNAATMRANAFMAIVHGSSSLFWWWWGQGSSRFYTVAGVPSAWDALRSVVKDIRSLEPQLVADGRVEQWIETPAEGKEIHVLEKRIASGTLIIAVNRERDALQTTFALHGLAGNHTGQALFPNRSAQVVNGRIKASFAPLEVHVYLFR